MKTAVYLGSKSSSKKPTIKMRKAINELNIKAEKYAAITGALFSMHISRKKSGPIPNLIKVDKTTCALIAKVKMAKYSTPNFLAM